MKSKKPADSRGPRVYAMCRVSSPSQVVKDTSVPAQIKAAKEYKERNLKDIPWAESSWPDGEHPGFYVDYGVSAWKKPFAVRPGASKLLSQLQSGDYLLIYSIDRGFRNSEDFGHTVGNLKARGVNVIFVSQECVNVNTAAGKLIGNMLAAMAQYSSDVKSERLKEAFAMRDHGLIKRKQKKERVIEDECHWRVAEFSLPDMPSSEVKNPPGKIYLYIRCSHIQSLESGLGLAAQQSRIEAYAKKLQEENPNLEILPIYADEAVSAFKTPMAKRPAGGEILRNIKKGDHLVVYRLDRAWRSIRDCAETVERFYKEGVHIHLVNEGASSLSPEGKMFFYTLGYIAWVESHLISVRTKAALDHMRREGIALAETNIFRVRKKNGKRRYFIDIDMVSRMKWVCELRERTGLSPSDLSNMIEKFEASCQGRPVRPPAISWGTRQPRFFTMDRILNWGRAYKAIAPLLAAKKIRLYTPEELLDEDRLFVKPGDTCGYKKYNKRRKEMGDRRARSEIERRMERLKGKP